MERMDFGLYYDTQSNSFLECDIREIQIAGRLAADELIEGGAFQIVLSTDVNIGDGGWFGKVKNWAKTMLNRVFRKQKVDEVIEEKAEKGVNMLLSNSDTEWVRERFKDFRLIEVNAPRSINSKGTGRGKVGELLIKSY